MRFSLFGTLVLLALAAGCGRDHPQLFAVVATPDDRPGDCLPLRAPSLASLPPNVLATLRPPSDDYVWLVGETFEGATGLAGALSSLTGQSALVSLTSESGGRSMTRALATVEKGKVSHTYFGTPLTPAYPNDDGALLSLTFEARLLDASALSTAKAVLSAVPAGGPAYSQILSAIAPPAGEKGDPKAEGLSQTYVLRDLRSCESGACQAVIADERLVVLSAAGGDSAMQLAASVCLKGTRLYETGGVKEHGGSYAVLRVAHARLPEEALGAPLADALAGLARCDRDFTGELAAKASDEIGRAETLRASDREVLAALVADAAFATKAQSPEARLEAERRLSASSAAVCAQTPAGGIACARAKSLVTCAAARAAAAMGVGAAYRQALSSVAAIEHPAGDVCDARGQGLVTLARDLAAVASAAQAAGLEGACATGNAGLSCEAFPELSKRSKAAVAEAQEALYRSCFCTALAQDRSPLAAARVVREAIHCENAPEEFRLAPAAESPLKDDDLAAYQAHRQTLAPALTAAQCPACVRLGRRVDDELARAVLLGKTQSAVAVLLRQALAPVSTLHDRAFTLMSGDASVRCAARPEEWSIIAQAVAFTVEPRDLFREGGQLDPGRLEAKLRQAELLRSSLDGLSCTREPPLPPEWPGSSTVLTQQLPSADWAPQQP